MICYIIKCEAKVSVIVIEEVIMDGHLAIVRNKYICKGMWLGYYNHTNHENQI